MPAPRGPRGEKVTIIMYWRPDTPNVKVPEAWASAGVRPGAHKSARDRAAELESEGFLVQIDTVTVR